MGGLRVFCSFRAILLRSLDGMTSWSHTSGCCMLSIICSVRITTSNVQTLLVWESMCGMYSLSFMYSYTMCVVLI